MKCPAGQLSLCMGTVAAIALAAEPPVLPDFLILSIFDLITFTTNKALIINFLKQ